MKKEIMAFLGASIFFIGIFTGIILEHLRQGEQKISYFTPTNISELPQIPAQQKIPVISLFPIENGILLGKISGNEVRIDIVSQSGKKSLTQVFQTGPLALDIREIIPTLKEIPHPKNTKFTASKRGKKFYALDDPRAFLVSPKNRIFFATEEDAKEKGFRRP